MSRILKALLVLLAGIGVSGAEAGFPLAGISLVRNVYAH